MLFGAGYPQTDHQLCIVHQIRKRLKDVSYTDRKEVVYDLQSIYKTSAKEEGCNALEHLMSNGVNSIRILPNPGIIDWDHLTHFLEYPEDIRQVIYTTNSIESANSQFLKATKNKKGFLTIILSSYI